MLKKVLPFLLIPILATWSQVYGGGPLKASRNPQKEWVDSIFKSMSPQQRLGQLFMVAAYSNKDEKHAQDIEKLINEYYIGGLIFFQGGPVRQAVLTNRFQAQSRVPMLVGMDAEWGLGMRLDSVMSFPRQMTLGAIASEKDVYQMGVEVARQCRRLGVHVNFAPVVDINNNPKNPVIGNRSFGEDKENVASKGSAYMRGMQHNGVMANAKHFPGHGDTDTDSHLGLPLISHNRERLSEIELYPFRRLMQDSLMSIMVAHLHMPAYDNTKDQATTLSKSVVTDLLKNELKFKGLIFTDALNMKGVSKFHKPGDVDVLALLAGNDVLLFSENVPEAIAKIEQAVKKKQISQKEIDERVRKILAAKYWAGLHQYRPVELYNIYNDLSNPKAEALLNSLYERSVTIAKNDFALLPFTVLDTNSFASVSINAESGNPMQQMLSNYANFKHYSVVESRMNYENVLPALKNTKTVVVGVYKMNTSASKNWGVSQATLQFLKSLRQQKKNVVIVVYGSPYSLKNFEEYGHVVCAYEENDFTQRLVPQALFGGIEVSGKLPVTASDNLKVGSGFFTKRIDRLRHGYPGDVGMDYRTLNRIDSIAYAAIAGKATPGCQVLVVKNGTVVFNKAYGHQTYDNNIPVTTETIYDIASVTKVTGTLQAVMFLAERGLIDVNKKASFYLPELKGTNKEHLIIGDILTHQAGLAPYIPYWKRTVKNLDVTNAFYSSMKDNLHLKQVSPGIYAINSMEDTLWAWTIKSELIPINKQTRKYDYKYSDLGFYMMKRICEKQLNMPIDEFLSQHIYEPLGTSTLTFEPLRKFTADRIAPTEFDKDFRKAMVHGTVHDQGAAMFGGVAGHAGLFSNATDLATLMQMNLQNGRYGGVQYLQPTTVSEFAKRHYTTNRRGFGWDKPIPVTGGPASVFASQNSYGHTGFTGTCVWVDPDHELVYIFLSNRIHPDSNNDKLIKDSIRTKIHDVIYQAFLPAANTWPYAGTNSLHRGR
jgi:beta-N-acetylhexosaminidase